MTDALKATPSQSDVARVWDALRERVCSSKLEAKRCVMVGREDIKHALIAASRGTRTLTEEERRYIHAAMNTEFDLDAPIRQEGGRWVAIARHLAKTLSGLTKGDATP